MNRVAAPRSFENRLEHACRFKALIGKAAADLVEEGECLLIDSGTTAMHVAPSLSVSCWAATRRE